MTAAMMIDLETLSTRPDAFVVQIGYAVGDPAGGFECGQILLGDEGQEHRHKDFQTIQWWMRQDPAVAETVFADGPRTPPELAYAVMCSLMKDYGIEEVWASPAMFDLPILTSLWEGRKPWSYKQERCMRTLREIVDPLGALAPPPNLKLHDAKEDAHWQMQYLGSLLNHLANARFTPLTFPA